MKVLLQSFVRPSYGHFRRWLKQRLAFKARNAGCFDQAEIRDVIVSGIPFPIQVREQSSDGRAMVQCLLEKQYNFDPGFEPKNILDLGGNIGCSAVYFTTRWPNAKVVVVEPVPDTYNIMKKNVSHYPNVVAVNAAAHPRREPVEMDVAGLNYWAATAKSTKSGSKSAGNLVPGMPVVDLLDEFGMDKVDILKMDIEGGEAGLFAADPHPWLGRTRLLVIELHDGIRMGCSWYLFRALKRYKTRLGQVGENLLVWLDGPR